MLKKHTEDLKENSYWLGSIDEYLYTGMNRMNDYEKIVNSITVNDIRKFADDLFKQKNEVEVTMVSPEKEIIRPCSTQDDATQQIRSCNYLRALFCRNLNKTVLCYSMNYACTANLQPNDIRCTKRIK